MHDPYTALPDPVTVDPDHGGPIPGQLSFSLFAAGYEPPPALSESYPFIPITENHPDA